MSKRFDDVMKSNLNLQSLLETVLSSLPGTHFGKGKEPLHIATPILGETSGNAEVSNMEKGGESGGMGSSERWWDRLCQSSDDEFKENNVSKRT